MSRDDKNEIIGACVMVAAVLAALTLFIVSCGGPGFSRMGCDEAAAASQSGCARRLSRLGCNTKESEATHGD